MFGRLACEIDSRRHARSQCDRAVLCIVLALGGLPFSAGAQNLLTQDYPTATRADYVFGCMAANGQTRLILERCSCSIDTIAQVLPYERYIQAETILSMRLVAGAPSEVFRTSPQFRDIVADLRRAQAEAEIECFP
jgi:hypothetical protein